MTCLLERWFRSVIRYLTQTLQPTKENDLMSDSPSFREALATASTAVDDALVAEEAAKAAVVTAEQAVMDSQAEEVTEKSRADAIIAASKQKTADAQDAVEAARATVVTAGAQVVTALGNLDTMIDASLAQRAGS